MKYSVGDTCVFYFFSLNFVTNSSMRNREELVLHSPWSCTDQDGAEMQFTDVHWAEVLRKLTGLGTVQFWRKQKTVVREGNEGLGGSPGYDFKRAGTNEKPEAVSFRYFLHPISPIKIHSVIQNYRIGLDWSEQKKHAFFCCFFHS